MKYASETIELMSAYPGRTWRMADLVRNASRGRTLMQRERDAVRKAVLRVVDQLVESGQVVRHMDCQKSAFYSWGSLGHGLGENHKNVGRVLRQ